MSRCPCWCPDLARGCAGTSTASAPPCRAEWQTQLPTGRLRLVCDRPCSFPTKRNKTKGRKSTLERAHAPSRTDTQKTKRQKTRDRKHKRGQTGSWEGCHPMFADCAASQSGCPRARCCRHVTAEPAEVCKGPRSWPRHETPAATLVLVPVLEYRILRIFIFCH